jgi:hypothetical protein
MEIAKFVLTAIGTFVSVSALTFTFFQFWLKRRDEKDNAFRNAIRKELEDEIEINRKNYVYEQSERKEADAHILKRVELLERDLMHNFQQRMGNIEGELKGLRNTLGKIEEWFIRNTPGG